MVGLRPPHGARAALVEPVMVPQISSSAAGKAAILNAIFGGAGHEWVTLASREVSNPLGLVAGFQSGAIKQVTVKGLVVKTPNWQAGYTGFPHDPLSLNVGGVTVLKRKQIELGAIVRGPFTTYPGTTDIVFGINRGAGQRLGPPFASRPGITPDALVTVTVGPFGQNNSATITDLTTGSSQAVSPAAIRVAGPTVRVLLNESQLPSTGFALKRYTFAVWTETQPNAPIQDVGSFVPESSMIPIGIETDVRPTF
jgi:hypothetical protein